MSVLLKGFLSLVVSVEHIFMLSSSAGPFERLHVLKEKQVLGSRYLKHCLDKPVCCSVLCHNLLHNIISVHSRKERDVPFTRKVQMKSW